MFRGIWRNNQIPKGHTCPSTKANPWLPHPRRGIPDCATEGSRPSWADRAKEVNTWAVKVVGLPNTAERPGNGRYMLSLARIQNSSQPFVWPKARILEIASSPRVLAFLADTVKSGLYFNIHTPCWRNWIKLFRHSGLRFVKAPPKSQSPASQITWFPVSANNCFSWKAWIAAPTFVKPK